MRVVSLVGARPNLMKIAPILTEMHRWSDIDSVLVHTGQHYNDNMSDIFFRQLGIPEPDYNLGVGSGTHTWQTAQVMLALEPLLHQLSPDILLVVGDVNSTLAAALVAAKMRIPLAHVEAGLRSFDRAMPEEINRVITDRLSDFLFTTERTANDNLRHEGVASEKVFFVGNVMVDTLLHHHQFALALNMPARYGVTRESYAVMTLHRPSNVDRPVILSGLLDAIDSIQSDLPILFPVHPRTRKQLAETRLLERANAMPNLRLIEPLGYLEFLGLMACSRLVMTDSGGVQEETTALDIPCLTLRENTERPATITEGSNELVGTSPDRIVLAVRRILNGEWKRGRLPQLWDGEASKRIVSVLRTAMDTRAPLGTCQTYAQV